MSTTTLLQLVQQAAGEMGISVPVSVAGNTQQDVIQLLALLNATGYELLTIHPWVPRPRPIVTLDYGQGFQSR